MNRRIFVGAAFFAGLALLAGATAFTNRQHLDRSKLEAIKPLLDREVADGVRAGFVAGVVSRNGETYITASGMADIENHIPMASTTRFRIASMTKPIITAAVMQLADRGVIALSDPVSLYIPSFAGARVALSEEPDESGSIPTRAPKRAVTVHDLLTHTAGMGYVFDNKSALDRLYLDANLFYTEGSLGERIDRIASVPLYNDPGEEWRYSYSIDVAAYLIEGATGEPLEDYLKRNIFEPLKMGDTEFFFDKSDFERLAALYEFGPDRKIRRAGGDAVSGNLNEDGLGVFSGGAGLVSSAHDYLRFCLMMLRGGEVDGVRVLSQGAVAMMMSDQLKPGAASRLWERESASFGLGGTVVINPQRAAQLAVAGEWGWTGYWDTWFVVNPADGVAALVLAQTQPTETMPPSAARDRVKAIAYGAARD